MHQPAVPLKKVAVHWPHVADVLLAERMRIVQQYDLTTAAGMDNFAQEIILQRTPITCDGNLRYQSYIHGRPSG